MIGNSLSFSNDEEGFHNLLLWIQRLQTAHNLAYPMLLEKSSENLLQEI
ncbi:hypothetical protein KZ483_21155 [Paenibacillus sp. sptzw28]|nr:hypothetical protein [Paenibacillus sp. sptzw28]QYR20306.1 hypothetical protein KZ483_21155 [Paenibacillus sp. sptzw28]